MDSAGSCFQLLNLVHANLVFQCSTKCVSNLPITELNFFLLLQSSQKEKKIVCFVTHGIYLYAELVLLGIYCEVGGLSEAFKRSEPLGPFLWIAEIEIF